MSRIVIPDASLLTPKQNQIEDKIEINTQRFVLLVPCFY